MAQQQKLEHIQHIQLHLMQKIFIFKSIKGHTSKRNVYHSYGEMTYYNNNKLLILIYKLNANTVKIQLKKSNIFSSGQCEKVILKFIWKNKVLHTVKEILENKTKM